MRSIREIIRLSFQCGQSHREISRATRVSPSTVGDYLNRAKAAGLEWPLPDTLGDKALEDLLFPPQSSLPKLRALPDFPTIHLELKKKGVTKALLWQEYKERHPDGYQYSQFCEMYNQ